MSFTSLRDTEGGGGEGEGGGICQVMVCRIARHVWRYLKMIIIYRYILLAIFELLSCSGY